MCLILGLLATAEGYNRDEMEGSMALGVLHPMQRIAPWLVDASRLDEDTGTYVAADNLILSRTGAEVTIYVTVSDERDKTNDILAVYTPFDADITQKSPARVARIRYDTVDRTTGQVKVYLTNMRSSYRFVVMTSPAFYCNPDPLSHGCADWSFFNGTQASIDAIARSPDPVNFLDPNEPRAPRVLPGVGNDFKIVWSSKGEKSDNGCQLSGGRGVVMAETRDPAFTSDELCGSPAKDVGFIDPGAVHQVTFSCEETEQYVTYQCGSVSGSYFSTRQFRCPRYPGQHDKETKIAIFADMGRGERDEDDSITFHEYGAPSRETTELLASYTDLDYVFHNGDLSYAVGYLSVIDDYLDMVDSFASKFPYGVGLGNHEYDWPSFPPKRIPAIYTGVDSGGECGVPSVRYFPVADTDLTNTSWWSTEVGMIHMAIINTEIDYTIDSPQWQWLDADLAAVNRSKTPWLIVSGHRPMYIDSSYRDPTDGGSGDINVMENLIANVEPLLLKYNVDLFWAGHNHAYQRQCTCANGACVEKPDATNTYRNPTAPLHLVVGTAGADFTRNAVGADFALNTMYKFGIGILTAKNATHLDLEFIDNGANGPDSTAGTVLDSASIVKPLYVPGPIIPPASESSSHHHHSKSGTSSTVTAIAAIVVVVAAALVLVILFLAYKRYANLPAPRDDDDSEHLSVQDLASPDRPSTSDAEAPLLDNDHLEQPPPSSSASTTSSDQPQAAML